MSEIKVSKLTSRAGTGAPDFSQGVKISGTASTLLAPTRTESATEPESPSNGDTWYDTDNDTYDVYINDEWKRFIGEGSGGAVWYGDRGVIAGGVLNNGNRVSDIRYFDITTTGNTTDFGDLTQGRLAASTSGDGTYATFTGGNISSNTNIIDYITVATVGNATDFGDMRIAGRNGPQGIGDGTYGIFSGNYANTNNIDYITIAVPSNSTAFGDLTVKRDYSAGHSDGTSGFICGGNTQSNIIEYITIATTGNGTDFGDLTQGRTTTGGGDLTRAVIGGGETTVNVNTIDYFATATAGNATDFGDMTLARRYMASTTNFTRVVWAGGFSHTNVMDYVVVQTTGNATDFGDLFNNINSPFGVSGAAA